MTLSQTVFGDLDSFEESSSIILQNASEVEHVGHFSHDYPRIMVATEVKRHSHPITSRVHAVNTICQ